MIIYSIYNLFTYKSNYTLTFTKYWIDWTSYMLKSRLLTKYDPVM